MIGVHRTAWCVICPSAEYGRNVALRALFIVIIYALLERD